MIWVLWYLDFFGLVKYENFLSLKGSQIVAFTTAPVHVLLLSTSKLVVWTLVNRCILASSVLAMVTWNSPFYDPLIQCVVWLHISPQINDVCDHNYCCPLSMMKGITNESIVSSNTRRGRGQVTYTIACLHVFICMYYSPTTQWHLVWADEKVFWKKWMIAVFTNNAWFTCNPAKVLHSSEVSWIDSPASIWPIPVLAVKNSFF